MLIRTVGESKKLLELLSERDVSLSFMVFVLKVKENFLWRVSIGTARLNDRQYRTLKGFLIEKFVGEV
ncbi:MAG: hypothetical protein E3J56_14985 [Candidatus Aminicenantes bacterium]|nr:MAG: hypothetical protein E3J56_14985 [Candidatus Aminicenantes bacterium]